MCSYIFVPIDNAKVATMRQTAFNFSFGVL